jgi:hypothetical protein
MRFELACAAVALLTLAGGCKRYPDTYAPPEQRQPLTLEEPPSLQSFIRMSDAMAPLHFVRDIRPKLEGNAWRWTLKSPTLQLHAPKASGMKFVAEVTVPDVTFKDTGPVAITVSINDHKLETFAFDQPGSRRIEKPIPDGWLSTENDNKVVMEIDKTWTAAADGFTVGFILTSVGFVE